MAYNNLIKEYISIMQAIDIESIKQACERKVTSKRTFTNINSISDLIRVLEDRDELSEKNVNLLENLLPKANETAIKKCRASIECYNKYIELESGSSYGKCASCGISLPLSIEHLEDSMQRLHIGKNSSPVEKEPKTVHVQDESELNAALMYLETKIGLGWKEVARKLGLTDNQTEVIVADNPLQLRNQISTMFRVWKQISGPAATVSKLTDVLQSSYVRRIDLADGLKTGKHLKQ